MDAPGAAGLCADLEAAGAQVRVAACDVADRDLPRRQSSGQRALGSLGGGARRRGTADSVVESLDPADLAAVLAPKVAGAWHLHELTADLPLTAFVLFSSAAGVLGQRGAGRLRGSQRMAGCPGRSAAPRRDCRASR